nr:hypothetical protein BaRGS_017700 [Batillaria attramentaria]
MSPPYWLPSLKSSLGRQEIGEEEFRVNQARLGSSSASLKRSQTCRPSSDQQRLAEMLNVMETLEQLDPENLNQLMRIRAQHNLTGVCPTFQPSEQLRGLEHQSLCPWTLEENYQVTRTQVV